MTSPSDYFPLPLHDIQPTYRRARTHAHVALCVGMRGGGGCSWRGQKNENHRFHRAIIGRHERWMPRAEFNCTGSDGRITKVNSQWESRDNRDFWVLSSVIQYFRITQHTVSPIIVWILLCYKGNKTIPLIGMMTWLNDMICFCQYVSYVAAWLFCQRQFVSPGSIQKNKAIK